MAITEHNWLDPYGVKIVRDVILNIIAENILQESFTDIVDETSDNKHRVSINTLISLLNPITQKLNELIDTKNEFSDYYTEFNVVPIKFFKGNPEDNFPNPSDDFLYVQLNDESNEDDLIWLWQKVKNIDLENSFTINSDGDLYITVSKDDPDMAFDITESGDLIFTTSNEQCNFELIDGNLYYNYTENSTEIDITEGYQWICIGKRNKSINNYWKKSDLQELKNTLCNGVEYRFIDIGEDYIRNKVSEVFAS